MVFFIGKFKKSYMVNNTINNLIYQQEITSSRERVFVLDSGDLQGFRFFTIGFWFFFPLWYYGCLEGGKAQSGAMQSLYREERVEIY